MARRAQLPDTTKAQRCGWASFEVWAVFLRLHGMVTGEITFVKPPTFALLS